MKLFFLYSYSCIFIAYLTLFGIVSTNPDLSFSSGDNCFCQLKGQVGDCSCNIDTVDYYNNAKIHPRLSSLLNKDYFRFFRVNLKRPCPFWQDDSKCSLEDCSVKPCDENNVPPGLKPSKRINKYSEEAQKKESCEEDNELGHLNTTISEESFEGFVRWRLHDAQDNFCELDDEKSASLEYVDLLLNPERYTGYKGPPAHRIWNSIYQENCFQPQTELGSYIDSQSVRELCLEKRAFYRAISGLHTSINIHLSASFLFPAKDHFSKGKWGPNKQEFLKRFSPESTQGEGPQWLKNLYFVYLLELRALAKAAPYLENEAYYTGNEEDDCEVRKAMKDILQVVNSFPDHFNESSMFVGNKKEAKKLKNEFKLHFRNISRIMDCVGCDKCKVWGKLQVQGLGTAFKILFSGNQKDDLFSLPLMRKDKFQLQRTEIVSLLNGFGRLSNSIRSLEVFRNMME